MTWAVVGLAAGALAAAGTAVALAIRLVTLGEEKADLQVTLGKTARRRQETEAQLQQVSREKNQELAAHRRQLKVLRGDMAELEDALRRCDAPGAVRARLSRLLEVTADRERAPEEES